MVFGPLSAAAEVPSEIAPEKSPAPTRSVPAPSPTEPLPCSAPMVSVTGAALLYSANPSSGSVVPASGVAWPVLLTVTVAPSAICSLPATRVDAVPLTARSPGMAVAPLLLDSISVALPWTVVGPP
ncbi:Uncharacterised protein [Xylophilus ampelinus]|nr:Uncharacterised protein [Xylophilus ampelinus]